MRVTFQEFAPSGGAGAPRHGDAAGSGNSGGGSHGGAAGGAGTRVHPSFRLWLTAEAAPPLPIGLLQLCVPVTLESGGSMKQAIAQCFAAVPTTSLQAVDNPARWRRLLYALCFLHAGLTGRGQYGNVAWSTPYTFAAADLTASLTYLLRVARDTERAAGLDWQAVQYVVCEATYGGRITNAHDRRIIRAFGDVWLQEPATDDPASSDFQFCNGDRLGWLCWGASSRPRATASMLLPSVGDAGRTGRPRRVASVRAPSATRRTGSPSAAREGTPQPPPATSRTANRVPAVAFGYHVPGRAAQSAEGTLAFINTLPDTDCPQVFGLHGNFAQASADARVQATLRGLKRAHPPVLLPEVRDSGGGTFPAGAGAPASASRVVHSGGGGTRTGAAAGLRAALQPTAGVVRTLRTFAAPLAEIAMLSALLRSLPHLYSTAELAASGARAWVTTCAGASAMPGSVAGGGGLSSAHDSAALSPPDDTATAAGLAASVSAAMASAEFTTPWDEPMRAAIQVEVDVAHAALSVARQELHAMLVCLQDGVPLPSQLVPLRKRLAEGVTPAHWCVYVKLFRERSASGPDGVATDEMDAEKRTVPEPGLSVPPVSRWLDFMQRAVQQLRTWAYSGTPRVVWLGGLAKPAAFLEALRQVAVKQSRSASLDGVRIVAEVTSGFSLASTPAGVMGDGAGGGGAGDDSPRRRKPKESPLWSPADDMLISGLHLHGAAWDADARSLVELPAPADLMETAVDSRDTTLVLPLLAVPMPLIKLHVIAEPDSVVNQDRTGALAGVALAGARVGVGVGAVSGAMSGDCPDPDSYPSLFGPGGSRRRAFAGTSQYACPMYATGARRQDEHVLDIWLPSQQPPQLWCLRGAALVCCDLEQ